MDGVARFTSKSAIFLDRSGVINQNEVRYGCSYAPIALTDFVILPGVSEAVKSLRAAGYLIIVVTNQLDRSTGRQSRETINKMHELMRAPVPIDDIEVCSHVDADNCGCRKPKPGMLYNAARKHDIALHKSWIIGDRWRDVEAGRAAGCRTVFIDYHYSAEPHHDRPDVVVRSLAEAVPIVLSKSRGL